MAQFSLLPGRLEPQVLGHRIGQDFIVENGAAVLVNDHKPPTDGSRHLALDGHELIARGIQRMEESWQPSRVIGADGRVIQVVLQVSQIQLLQAGVKVLAPVHVDAPVLQHDAGKALTVLDVHILQEGTLRQLRPIRYLGEISQDKLAGRFRVQVGHTAQRYG